MSLDSYFLKGPCTEIADDYTTALDLDDLFLVDKIARGLGILNYHYKEMPDDQ